MSLKEVACASCYCIQKEVIKLYKTPRLSESIAAKPSPILELHLCLGF